MKKKPINTVLNALIEITIALSIILIIASAFSKCTKNKLDKQTLEILNAHSDKGLVTEQNRLIIVKKVKL